MLLLYLLPMQERANCAGIMLLRGLTAKEERMLEPQRFDPPASRSFGHVRWCRGPQPLGLMRIQRVVSFRLFRSLRID